MNNEIRIRIYLMFSNGDPTQFLRVFHGSVVPRVGEYFRLHGTSHPIVDVTWEMIDHELCANVYVGETEEPL